VDNFLLLHLIFFVV